MKNVMKKIFMILILAAVICFTVSCSDSVNEGMDANAARSEATDEADINNDTDNSDDQSENGFVCTLSNGVAVTIGGKLPELGEPIRFSEAPSCVHEGTDKVYSYDGFTITTSPDGNGNDYVSEISLVSDAVSMNGDITIGVVKDVIITAFGEEYTEQFGVMTYNKQNAVISIVLDDNSAVSGFVVSMAE